MAHCYTVTFGIKYERSNFDDPIEMVPDPTAAEFEQYVADSVVIPEHPSYMNELEIISDVVYLGGGVYQFACETDLLEAEVQDLFYNQSLADGEWEACPGYGSFVYPFINADGETEELGLLSFDRVVVLKL